ncbi:hypothetical protein HMPREF0005_02852 [Achromobacter xylosoxidans C54]|uniref:hypothetical protein n=1 Tax=Alcaligenes xylosoxydans xylosoxydans TaxID=85698 RepID=UPI0001F435DB|nr:hypothetical protein [Achromobacter xylosoxidans]EFV84110.1 hypothetical protein HMPREF0005_02852 [Achromobacter xylosoxidans C54]
MDLPTFFNEGFKNLIALLGVVAWPATVLAVVWLFRDEIRLKIRSLAAAQAPGVSVQFANRLEEAEQTAVEADLRKPDPSELDQEEILPDANEPPVPVAEPYGPILTSAASRIIQMTFSELVAELRKKAGALGHTADGTKKRRVESMVDDLRAHADMPDALGHMILELKELRDLAVADPYGVSTNDVLRYTKLAKDVKRGIWNLPRIS